jgi:hypothetical protein
MSIEAIEGSIEISPMDYPYKANETVWNGRTISINYTNHNPDIQSGPRVWQPRATKPFLGIF